VVLNNAEKVALLEKLAPLFPKGHTLPKHDGQSFETLVSFARDVYKSHMLGYWQELAPAYRQALSEPLDTDSAYLVPASHLHAGVGLGEHVQRQRQIRSGKD
jgi:hypothetical protein